MKALVVGYGYMGEIRLRVTEALEGIEVAGIADPHPAAPLPDAYPVFDDWREALDRTDPDVVFVCTPNHLIPDIACAALEQGRHVFCEKPPGRNLADIQRICAAEAASPGSKLIFGFNHRHHPSVVDAKAIVDSGAVGRILVLRGVYGKSGGSGFEHSWRNDPAVGGGGILLDQGIHMLDLFRHFCGDFTQVMGMRQTSHWDIPMEDNAFVLLRNASGQMAQLHSSATQWKHMFRLEITLEGGYLHIAGLLSKSGSYGREHLLVGRRSAVSAVGNPSEEITYYDTDLSWDTEVRHLLDCIREDRPVEIGSSTDALRVMEIVESVYASDPVTTARS
ncbi:MAG: Gfo/Idh/MocA family oxidoreductase [Longimicrobiales bacterium]